MSEHPKAFGESLAGRDRFEADAARYADYLETFEGRLRLDLAWANLRWLIGEAGLGNKHAGGECGGEQSGAGGRRALDVGGGTGAMALRLAAEGWDVVVLDSSAGMLTLAAEAARGTQFAGRVTFRQADAARIGDLFPCGSFDAALCHNVLEYLDDECAVVKGVSGAVRPGGVVSVLARARAGEAMRAALKSHDLDAARRALTARQVSESLYGGAVRLFDAPALRALAEEAALEVLAERGVRVLADYLPAALHATAQDYARLLAFELELGARSDFAAVARYTQILARRAGGG